MACYASDYWTVEFQRTATSDVIEHLEKMFHLTASNPDAACLDQEVTFTSGERWPTRRGPELVTKIMVEAGCNRVEFKGNSYTLGI